MRRVDLNVEPGLVQVLRFPLPFALMASLWGCTTVHEDFKTYAASSSIAGSAGRAAIVLPDALCSLYYDNGNLTAFELGPTICNNARIVAKAAFSDVSFFSAPDEVDAADYDVIGILRPGDVRTHGTKRIPATVATDVNLRWSFRVTKPAGRYASTLHGHGEDTRTYGMADVRYQASMQRCMDSLAANLQHEMTQAVAKAGNNGKATDAIRAQVAGFRIGHTTYGDYRSARTHDWRSFAVDEQVTCDGSLFRYLNDSVQGVHDAVMGSCTTHWVKPWPVIDDLRPSVYLTQGKIDRSLISGFRLRELVGSVYDENPLCELIFEGGSFDEAVLTHRSCDGDFNHAGVYASIDQSQDGTLNETARKWLKLRVGMSRREIGALIGAPTQMIHSNLSGWLYEYGHGRIRLDDNERLLYWQLRELPSVFEQQRMGAGRQEPGCLRD